MGRSHCAHRLPLARISYLYNVRIWKIIDDLSAVAENSPVHLHWDFQCDWPLRARLESEIVFQCQYYSEPDVLVRV